MLNVCVWKKSMLHRCFSHGYHHLLKWSIQPGLCGSCACKVANEIWEKIINNVLFYHKDGHMIYRDSAVHLHFILERTLKLVLRLNTLLAILTLNKSTSWDNGFRYRNLIWTRILAISRQPSYRNWWMNFEENFRFSTMTSTLWTWSIWLDIQENQRGNQKPWIEGQTIHLYNSQNKKYKHYTEN